MARMSISYLEMRSGNHQAAIRSAMEGLGLMKPFAGTHHESPSYNQAMGGLHVHAARWLRPYRPDSKVSFNPIALATATSVENRGLPRGESAR